MNVANKLAAIVAMFAFARAQFGAAVRVNRRRGRARADQAFPETDESLVHRAANAGTVISVVVIGVVAMVGILIFSQVESALPAMSTNESHDDYHPLASTLESVTGGFGNALEFVPIVMLVLLASVVIAIVQRMRS